MKKIIYVFSAFYSFLLFTGINHADGKNRLPADRNKRAVQNKARNVTQANAMIQKQQADLAAKHSSAERTASVTSERLIATSYYSYDYTDTPYNPVGINDSAAYTYSGERGSVFNNDLLGFNTPYGSNFSAGNAFTYYFSGYMGSFNANINISNLLADNAMYWNTDNTDSVGNNYFSYDEKVYNIYDVNNNVTFCSDQNNPIDSSGQWANITNTYDSNKNIVTSLTLQWSGSGWDSSSYSFFSYNTDGQLVMDSTAINNTGVWLPTYKDYYNYNSFGNVVFSSQWNTDTTAWVEQNQYFMNYNTDNTLHSDSLSINMSGVWTPYQTDSFGYTAGVSYWTALKVYNYFGPGYEAELISKHVAISGLPDSLYETITGSFSTFPSGFIGGGKAGLVFDAYNNPSIEYAYGFNVTDSTTGDGSYSPTPLNISHFYYQNYSTGEAVHNVSAPAAQVTVFPNPATGNIGISISGIAQGARIQIILENMLGQTIITQSVPWMGETQNLSLQGIVPGNYILQVQDIHGNILAVKKIVKQ